MNAVTVQDTTPETRDAILALYPRAFPEEDLTPLVATLVSGEWPILSIALMQGDRPLGHLLFTLFDIHGSGDGALLGPLCIDPSRQGGGLGTALMRDGLKRLVQRGIGQVFVLGDPGYYGRFGFAADRRAPPPYPLPPDWDGAWQSLRLTDAPPASGLLTLPAPWMQPALWQP